jgi:hypothetical protein
VTNDEQTIYLRALLDGTSLDADAALERARGSGPTTLELRGLEEEGLVELVHLSSPSLSKGEDGPVIDVLGLTGVGAAFTKDLPDDL